MTGLQHAMLTSAYAVLEFKSPVILQLLSIFFKIIIKKKKNKNRKADNLLAKF